MNKWTCNNSECKNQAVGIGSAIGLRSIGWYFQPGFEGNLMPLIFCPGHHPDGYEKAEIVARKIQNLFKEKP